MTRTGIILDADVGGFISNLGRAKSAVSAITQEMNKAEKEERFDDWAKLKFDRDRIENTSRGFDRDTKTLTSSAIFQQIASRQESGQKLSKADEQFISEFHDMNGNFKKLTEAFYEAIKDGNMEKAREISPQLDEQARDFHKFAEQANTPTGMRGMQEAVKAIGIEKITSAINAGFSQWVGSLDRSGIVNQYGSGDILGGRISEERRQADLWGGVAQAGLGLVGTVAGAFTPLGPMGGGVVGSALGKGIDSFLHIGPNKESTEAAYAGLWQQRSGASMELAAVLGDPGKVREAFKMAADAAAEFGYSAEEGMDAMKQAAQQGLSGEEMKAVVNQSFDYERRTGADRNTLMGISTMSARYGAGDALSAGWAGLGASGMSPGQYNEYLRAMQRVMEDGISKGFVRSSKDVAESFAFLSAMTGNDPTWQGENGAKRLSEMSSGIAGTTGLKSTSDILAFRAARNLMEKKEIKERDYTDVNAFIEQHGTDPEYFKELMEVNKGVVGGSREDLIENIMAQYGITNYTSGQKLVDGYDPNMKIPDLAKAIADAKATLPSANSPELDAEKTTQAITNWWTQTGISHWDDNFPQTLAQELAKSIREYNKETGNSVPVPGEKPVIPISDDMSANERYDAAEQNAITLAGRGDYAGAERATAEWRRSEYDLLRQNQDAFAISDKVKSAAGGMFDEIFGSREDKAAHNTVMSLFGDDMWSEDASRKNSALEFSELLGAVDKKTLDNYNKNDSWNQLSSAGDIQKMTELLQKILEATETNGKINVAVEG